MHEPMDEELYQMINLYLFFIFWIMNVDYVDKYFNVEPPP